MRNSHSKYSHNHSPTLIALVYKNSLQTPTNTFSTQKNSSSLKNPHAHILSHIFLSTTHSWLTPFPFIELRDSSNSSEFFSLFLVQRKLLALMGYYGIIFVVWRCGVSSLLSEWVRERAHFKGRRCRGADFTPHKHIEITRIFFLENPLRCVTQKYCGCKFLKGTFF